MDNGLETIHHTLYHCSLLTDAFDVIDTSFWSTGPHPFAVQQLLQDNTASSPGTPAGHLGWSALFTNWTLHCAKKRNSFFVITWESFCRKWHNTLKL